ncbi:MAG: PLDc N-terminal domain-containing protein [Mycobacterium sp.]|nr:PLDc N-terminal domain-containing protein [Mycobacterium sp.]
MGVVVVSVAALLWVWAIGEAIALDGQHLPSGEKAAWVAAVMLLPVVGALAWLLVGRRATRMRPTPDWNRDLDGCSPVSRARLRGWGEQRLGGG